MNHRPARRVAAVVTFVIIKACQRLNNLLDAFGLELVVVVSDVGRWLVRAFSRVSARSVKTPTAFSGMTFDRRSSTER